MYILLSDFDKTKYQNNCFCFAIYRVEGIFGRKSDGGFCVSKAMQVDLMKNFEVKLVANKTSFPHNSDVNKK